jgi:hypothetical protein
MPLNSSSTPATGWSSAPGDRLHLRPNPGVVKRHPCDPFEFESARPRTASPESPRVAIAGENRPVRSLTLILTVKAILQQLGLFRTAFRSLTVDPWAQAVQGHLGRIEMTTCPSLLTWYPWS